MITIDEKHPDAIAYRAAQKKMAALRATLVDKENELSEATERYLARKSNRVSAVERDASALLDLVPAASDDIGPDVIEKLNYSIEVLNSAIERQGRIVNERAGQFSLLICNANRQRYLEIERRITDATTELARANEEEAKFFSELLNEGCRAITFRPMRIHSVGFLTDPYSGATLHLREVTEFLPEILPRGIKKLPGYAS